MNVIHPRYITLIAACLSLGSLAQIPSPSIFQEPDNWDFSILTNDTSEQHPLPTSLEGWKEHLELFGKHIPQEEVFVHMDNTCYFLGDTLYFKAYVRRSDNQRLTDLSRLLYAELWNQDGYLMERRLIYLEKGQGIGSFILNDSLLYAGFYELRAYTRWQLNWGEFQHPHTWPAERFFLTKKMAKEFYRDYEKLYSRIFPVYDKPKEPGDYSHDMTTRPMFRYFKSDEKKPKPVATFYPEGGVVVRGTRARLAFEANEQDGEHLEGTMTVFDSQGNIVAQAHTENRGRGTVEFDYGENTSYKARFVTDEGVEIKPDMPQAETDGCAVRADFAGDQVLLTFQPRGTAREETLGVTVMTGGALRFFQKLSARDARFSIPISSLPTGVAQITVYNAQGRVYSDRLIFIRHADIDRSAVQFSDIEHIYAPFDSVHVSVCNPYAAGATVSVAVRDAAYSQYLYDSSNMLTEMLLCSQIKGFVEHPDYYFEADDSVHRRHLDLLLMVQGWRRHNWITMATPGIFRVNHPIEITPVYYGTVSRYDKPPREGLYGWGISEFQRHVDFDFSKPGGGAGDFFWRGTAEKRSGAIPTLGWAKVARDKHSAYSHLSKDRSPETPDGMNYYSQGRVRREVLVHAEFVHTDQAGLATMIAEAETHNGRFVLQMPSFWNDCVMNLSASDTTKWNNKIARMRRRWAEHRKRKGKSVKSPKFSWVYPVETEYPEFYVRLTPYYPRFVKPFSFYHTHVAPPREGTALAPTLRDSHMLEELKVRARHGGLRAITADRPAFVKDAYQVFNDCVDAGFSPGWYTGPNHFIQWIQRLYVGDMNLYGDTRSSYIFADGVTMSWNSPPWFQMGWSDPSFAASWGHSSNNFSSNIPTDRSFFGSNRWMLSDPADIHADLLKPGSLNRYSVHSAWNTPVRGRYSPTGFGRADIELYYLRHIKSIALITDYCPRLEGNRRYWGANRPGVGVNLITYGEEGVRPTFRDRHYVLQGYSVCEDFYRPCYRQRPLPDHKDYRRTLYWEPNLKLDAKGRASFSFWNNGKQTAITVSAEGIAPNGQIVSGISYPEDR